MLYGAEAASRRIRPLLIGHKSKVDKTAIGGFGHGSKRYKIKRKEGI